MEFKDLLDLFVPEGIWAVLSLALIFYIIKSQEKRDQRQDERDKKFQEIIMGLSESIKDIREVKNILVTLKNDMVKKD